MATLPKSKSFNVRRTVYDGFRAIISKFLVQEWTYETSSFSATFALERAVKKLEVPDKRRSALRYQQCWERWQTYDYSLAGLDLNPQVLARIRPLSYSYWGSRHLKLRPDLVEITNGSTFISTRGHGSVEDKLEDLEWTCTASCFRSFGEVCYGHNALKKIAKKRIKAHCLSHKIPYRALCRELFVKYSHLPKRKVGCEIFIHLLRAIVTIVPGSRFSTVPKNNEKDRPINMEPFGNLVVQRLIGLAFKRAILDQFGVDLDHVAEIHRRSLSQAVATIDLSDASDSITKRLVMSVLPTHIVNVLMNARSPYVYEPRSKDYHFTEKISSMGNGFTFELMTYILLCLTRSYDPKASVFGDDILIKDEHAEDVLDSLKGIGFVPNMKKTSYGTNPFRESCGANWHAVEGYIYSVDLHFPKDIVDCIVFYNKVLCLKNKYGIFSDLEADLRRLVPEALRGRSPKGVHGPLDNICYDDYFHIDGRANRLPDWCQKALVELHYKPTGRMFTSFKKVSKRSNKTTRNLRSDQLGKYLMYLYAGRVCDNNLVDVTSVATVTFVKPDEAEPMRVSALG